MARIILIIINIVLGIPAIFLCSGYAWLIISEPWRRRRAEEWVKKQYAEYDRQCAINRSLGKCVPPPPSDYYWGMSG